MIEASYTYANAAISKDGTILQDIHLKAKNIAIYQRDIEPLSNELNHITGQTVECRASGSVAEILSKLNAYFSSHLGACPSLFEDMSDLLSLFEKTSRASSFRLLLTTVSTNMCRRFHTDVNDLRLLCTYMGPGTLWLLDEAINHKAFQAGGDNQEIVTDEALIQQVGTGDVVILKGALYPDANPILHRSPAIEENRDQRLLLRIDTNESLKFLC